MNESVPRISMSTSAHYVTQSSMWGTHVLGRLTSRKINEYRRQGYYGGTTIRQDAAAAKRRTRAARATTLKTLLSSYA